MLYLPYDRIVGPDFGFKRLVGSQRLAHHVARQQVDGHAIALRHAEQFKCMERYVDFQIARLMAEIDRYQQRLVIAAAQEHVLLVRIQCRVVVIDIHQVEEASARNGLFAVAQAQYGAIFHGD